MQTQDCLWYNRQCVLSESSKERVIYLQDQYKLGEVVKSTAGRDKGSYYLVVNIESNKRIKIVDGVYRKFNNPKYKNSRHLESTGYVSEEFLKMLEKKKRVRSKDVREILKGYKTKEEA